MFNMLWLAGLMGIMAVGTVAFVDPQTNSDDEDDLANSGEDTSSAGQATLDIPTDNFEPDYDPRGGDDAALLEPANVSDADVVTLQTGTEDDDQLDGTDTNDRLRGLDGDDVLSGGLGNDELRGDDGDDTLFGNTGDDTLHGLDGGDVVHGGEENDVLFGHNANDSLDGGAGNDAIQGSAGNDALYGREGHDTMQGGLDNDTLIAGAGADALFGGWGDDVLSGVMRNALGEDEDDSDFLNGGGGDDSILVGNGDIVTAGDGEDEIVLGDWLASGEAAQILDFTAADDSLVLVWDDSEEGSSEPLITISADPDADDQTLVLMDGAVVATVNGSDILPADIALIPFSTATHVGLAAS
jgi:Ca2+-binding RTX toxin-like protein